MAGRLQDADHKTLAELTGAGGAVSQLLNDTKIYITSLAKQFSQAIADGDFAGGALFVNSPQTISGGGTISITAGKNRQLCRVKGGSGGTTASSSTPIANGSIDGQEVVIEGLDNTDTLVIGDSGNVSLNGEKTLGLYSGLTFVWNNTDTKWVLHAWRP